MQSIEMICEPGQDTYMGFFMFIVAKGSNNH